MSKEVTDGELSDEEMRKLLKPNVSQIQVAQLLSEHYCTTSTTDEENQTAKVLRSLDSYDDANFMVQIGDTNYLFKVHNGVESQDYLRVLQEAGGEYYQEGGMKSCIHLQNAILETLTQHNIQTTAPVQPLTAKCGDKNRSPPLIVQRLPVVSNEHSPCMLVCRLLSWVPGTPMSSVKLLPLEALADAGRFLGYMDRALDRVIPDVAMGLVALRRVESRGLEKSMMAATAEEKLIQNNDMFRDESLAIPARRYHQWDGKNTADLHAFVRYIKDEKRRGLVVSVLDAFQKEIVDSGDAEKFRKGINHGDFNDANIIMSDDMHVSGVIDFGDSVESWRILDVTLAMAYAMLSTYGKKNCSVSAAAALLRGYNAIEPLTSLERKHLVLLMACRLSCSVTIGAYSYQQNPENKYLLLHSEPAWKALELIWSYNADERVRFTQAINRVFEQACLYTDYKEENITCYDLVFPDPGVADLLQCVRVSSLDTSERPRKKPRVANNSSTITFVTGNTKKLEEVQRILGMDGKGNHGPSHLPFHLTNMKVNLPELQGNPVEVAKVKCIAAVKEVGSAVIVEDTSLCFNALNGLPGVYIKWFLDSCGHTGLNKILAGFDDKTAYAQTVVAFCPGPGKETAVFDGRTSGKIVMARGELGFGWDPIFEPDEGQGKTYAEMSKDEKDAVSHRSRAFSRLRDYLDKFRRQVLADMA